jgi:ribose transport system substrate-binding protein
MIHSTIRPRRAALALVLAVSSAIALAACSTPSSTDTSKSSSSSVPADVTTSLAKYEGTPTLAYSGTPFDASSLKGKKVWWVPWDNSNPFLAALGANFQKAMTAQGIGVTTCDGKSNPVDYNGCISSAVSHGAAAIEADGIVAQVFATPLAQAVKAGIPVLNGAGEDAADPLFKGLAGQSSQPFTLAGGVAADWIIADSGASAHVLFLTSPDVIGSVQEQKAFSSRMKAECPKCDVTVKGVTVANWATDLGTTTNAELLKNPAINYVVPAFDPMSQFTDPAIQQAGKSSSVKVVTVNGSLQQMKDLSTKGLVKAEVGFDLNALGYIEADQLMRVLDKLPPTTSAYAPMRLFDAKNVGGLTLTQDAANNGSWYAGSGTTEAAFTKLWAGN